MGRKKSVASSKRTASSGLHELAHGHTAASSSHHHARSQFEPYPQALPYVRPIPFDPARVHHADPLPMPSYFSSPTSWLPSPSPSHSNPSPACHPAASPYTSDSAAVASSSSSQYDFTPDSTGAGPAFFWPPTNTLDDATLCYCGPLCSCPGCFAHDSAGLKLGASGQGHNCGSECTSFGLCSSDVALPRGVSSIVELMAVITESEAEKLPTAQVDMPPHLQPRQPFSQLQGTTMINTSLAHLFETHTTQLQAWPSTSDLVGDGSRAESIYGGSISSLDGHGGFEGGVSDQAPGGGGGGARAEDIARWRSNLSFQVTDFPTPYLPSSSHSHSSLLPGDMSQTDYSPLSTLPEFDFRSAPTPVPTSLALDPTAYNDANTLLDPHPTSATSQSSSFSQFRSENYAYAGSEYSEQGLPRSMSSALSEYSASGGARSEADGNELRQFDELAIVAGFDNYGLEEPPGGMRFAGVDPSLFYSTPLGETDAGLAGMDFSRGNLKQTRTGNLH